MTWILLLAPALAAGLGLTEDEAVARILDGDPGRFLVQAAATDAQFDRDRGQRWDDPELRLRQNGLLPGDTPGTRVGLRQSMGRPWVDAQLRRQANTALQANLQDLADQERWAQAEATALFHTVRLQHQLVRHAQALGDATAAQLELTSRRRETGLADPRDWLRALDDHEDAQRDLRGHRADLAATEAVLRAAMGLGDEPLELTGDSPQVPTAGLSPAHAPGVAGAAQRVGSSVPVSGTWIPWFSYVEAETDLQAGGSNPQDLAVSVGIDLPVWNRGAQSGALALEHQGEHRQLLQESQALLGRLQAEAATSQAALDELQGTLDLLAPVRAGLDSAQDPTFAAELDVRIATTQVAHTEAALTHARAAARLQLFVAGGAQD